MKWETAETAVVERYLVVWPQLQFGRAYGKTIARRMLKEVNAVSPGKTKVTMKQLGYKIQTIRRRQRRSELGSFLVDDASKSQEIEEAAPVEGPGRVERNNDSSEDEFEEPDADLSGDLELSGTPDVIQNAEVLDMSPRITTRSERRKSMRNKNRCPPSLAGEASAASNESTADDQCQTTDTGREICLNGQSRYDNDPDEEPAQKRRRKFISDTASSTDPDYSHEFNIKAAKAEVEKDLEIFYEGISETIEAKNLLLVETERKNKELSRKLGESLATQRVLEKRLAVLASPKDAGIDGSRKAMPDEAKAWFSELSGILEDNSIAEISIPLVQSWGFRGMRFFT